MLTNWQPEPVRNGELTMQEYILQGMVAVDINKLDLMKGCEQAPKLIKEEDLKPDGFPITD
jgi:hypothetical protein